MIKPHKQIQIDFVISCLQKGEQRGKILAKFVKKWQTSERGFDRVWKIAKQQHTDNQQLIKEKLAAIDIAAATNARKKAIMTADERKEYLTKIILGEIQVPYQEVKWNPLTKEFETIDFVELANHSTRISAISELNKMEGDYAPTKVANTDSEGNDVQPPLSPVQYEKLIELVNKSGGKS